MASLGNNLQAGTITDAAPFMVELSGSSNTLIHSWIFDFLNTHAASFNGQDRERVQTIIDGPNFAEALQASFSKEQDATRNMILALLRAFQTGQTTDGNRFTEKDIKDLQTMFGSNPSETQFLGHLQKIREASQQSLYWPDDQFQKWLSDYRRRTANPALLDTAKRSSRMRDEYRAAVTNQQMVKAGWTVMEEGPTAISRLREPLTGIPFGYRKIDEQGSFELQSEVLNKGKPVTMTFPRSGR